MQVGISRGLGIPYNLFLGLKWKDLGIIRIPCLVTNKAVERRQFKVTSTEDGSIQLGVSDEIVLCFTANGRLNPVNAELSATASCSFTVKKWNSQDIGKPSGFQRIKSISAFSIQMFVQRDTDNK